MSVPPSCPRCAGALRPPGLWSSAWECGRHGAVEPYHVAALASDAVLATIAGRAKVPVWLPQPLFPDWTVTGLGHAGDERTGPRAVAVALAGPSPLGGSADLVLVAEEPGVGLGARYAGLPGTDPGTTPQDATGTKVHAARHPTPLWSLPAPDDRAAFVGEAKGVWLWAVLWPATAGVVLLEDVELADLREQSGHGLVFGAPSPYLGAPPGGWADPPG